MSLSAFLVEKPAGGDNLYDDDYYDNCCETFQPSGMQMESLGNVFAAPGGPMHLNKPYHTIPYHVDRTKKKKKEKKNRSVYRVTAQLKNLLKLYGTFWNSMEVHGISQKPWKVKHSIELYKEYFF